MMPQKSSNTYNNKKGRAPNQDMNDLIGNAIVIY